MLQTIWRTAGEVLPSSLRVGCLSALHNASAQGTLPALSTVQYESFYRLNLVLSLLVCRHDCGLTIPSCFLHLGRQEGEPKLHAAMLASSVCVRLSASRKSFLRRCAEPLNARV